MKHLLIRKILIITLMVLCILCSSFVYADGIVYEPVYGSSTTFQKVLIIDKETNIPPISFEYTVVPGDGIVADPGTSMEIIKPIPENGVTGVPAVGYATFNPDDTHLTVTSAEGIEIGSGEKAAIKTIQVDFSCVQFREPGVYRYLIKEVSKEQQGIQYDTQLRENGVAKQRTLDVYVIDEGSELKVSQYVIHELTSAIPAGKQFGSAHNPVRLADKSAGFVNEYYTCNLILEKMVNGNQASKDKYFKFDITVENAGSNVGLNIDWTNAEDGLEPYKSKSTVYDESIMKLANNRDDNTDFEGFQWNTDMNGGATATVYLKHGQKIIIRGLAKGAKYTITEANEDYSAKVIRNSEEKDGNVLVYESDGMNEDHNVTFANTRNGIVPTGIILSAGSSFALIGLSAAGICSAVISRRKISGGNKVES